MKQKKFKLENDFLDFIDLCNKHSVKYLVIGGYAVNVHGYVRYTKDIDIAIESSDENARKVVLVIDEFGLGSLGLKKEDFLLPSMVTQLGHEPIRIDILNGLEGMSFDQAWERRKEVLYHDHLMNFVGLDDF